MQRIMGSALPTMSLLDPDPSVVRILYGSEGETCDRSRGTVQLIFSYLAPCNSFHLN